VADGPQPRLADRQTVLLLVTSHDFTRKDPSILHISLISKLFHLLLSFLRGDIQLWYPRLTTDTRHRYAEIRPASSHGPELLILAAACSAIPGHVVLVLGRRGIG